MTVAKTAATPRKTTAKKAAAGNRSPKTASVSRINAAADAIAEAAADLTAEDLATLKDAAEQMIASAPRTARLVNFQVTANVVLDDGVNLHPVALNAMNVNAADLEDFPRIFMKAIYDATASL